MKEQNDNYFYIPQIKRRNQKAALFKGATIMAIVFSVSFLIFFLVDLGRSGYPAFFQTYVKMEVTINEEVWKIRTVRLKAKTLESPVVHG